MSKPNPTVNAKALAAQAAKASSAADGVGVKKPEEKKNNNKPQKR